MGERQLPQQRRRRSQSSFADEVFPPLTPFTTAGRACFLNDGKVTWSPSFFTRRQNSEAQESHEAFFSTPLPHVTVHTLQAHTHAQTPTAEFVSKSGQSARHSPLTPASVEGIRSQLDRVLGKTGAQLA